MTLLVNPPGAWELLVVNNNCTDHTDEVLNEYAGRFPLRRVFEPNPGLSNARNAAVDAAAGSHIVWTDDDVFVDSHWLYEYAKAFENHADAAFFGGLIEPWFEGDTPGWLVDAWASVADAFAARDLGPKSLELDARQLPYGANYAVRLEVQRRFRYDSNLGRRPDCYWLGGEESAVLREIVLTGGTGWWVPAARVKHWIPKNRQSTTYLRGYFEGQGRYMALVAKPEGRRFLMRRPVWLWRKVACSQVRYYWKRCTAGPESWVPALVSASTDIGVLKGSR